MSETNSKDYGSLEDQVLVFLAEVIKCVKARQNPLANALLDAQPEGLRGVMLRDTVWRLLAVVLNCRSATGGHIIDFDSKNPTVEETQALLKEVYTKVEDSRKNVRPGGNGSNGGKLRLVT